MAQASNLFNHGMKASRSVNFHDSSSWENDLKCQNNHIPAHSLSVFTLSKVVYWKSIYSFCIYWLFGQVPPSNLVFLTY